MSGVYYRPICQLDSARPAAALPLAGGSLWFDRLERLTRGAKARIISPDAVPDAVLRRLTAPRAAICGLSLLRPRLIGVLNVTPDSFSDGGRFGDIAAAVRHGQLLHKEGADILDIGGESTRPGADFVDSTTEIARIKPVVAALAAIMPVSIDTRKSEVAAAALAAGAGLVNDVSALRFDPDMADIVQRSGVPVCLMHAAKSPKTMQQNPQYDDVLLDVYDHLAERIAYCRSIGIDRARIIVDPGIGFGKTEAHNLALIRGLSLFHSLGCAILLGVSRKHLIGEIAREPVADRRMPGSIAVGLEGLRQGVQMLRVHDIRETRQAVALWRAVNMPD